MAEQNSKENIFTSSLNADTVYPRKRITQNFLLIWLDTSIDESTKDCHDSLAQLGSVVNIVNIFTDQDKAIDFLTKDHGVKTFLVVEDSIGQQILPLIHDIPQLDAVYIFGRDQSEDGQWTKKWSKIKGVHTEVQPLCEALQQTAKQCDQGSIAISFITLDDGSPRSNLNQLEPNFMYSQIFKEILLNMKYNQGSMDNFTTYCREGNHGTSSSIDRFEKEYYEKSPIWWYTSSPLVYRMLNAALRLLEAETIINLGFFIHDLHNQIQQLYLRQLDAYCGGTFTVYRGQGLAIEDFEKLQKAKGGLMSFNNFLSTSFDHDVSYFLAEGAAGDTNKVGILFKISIDPSISSTPFASIKDFSQFAAEEEILLSMHTVFRVGEITKLRPNSSLCQVDLQLTADDDQELRTLTEHIRTEVVGETGWEQLTALLVKIGHFNKAEELCNTLLRHSSNLHNKARHYNNLGYIKTEQGANESAIELFQKALEISQENLPANHLDLAISYNNLGSVFKNMGEYSKALSFYEKALEIRQKTTATNHPDLATSYNNIGSLYDAMRKYSKALSFHEKALEIHQKRLPANHPDLATSYNNLGGVYYSMGEYSAAAPFYEKALVIFHKSLPAKHPDLATSYNNMGSVYKNMGEYSKAISFYEKALEIRHKTLSADHPALATSYNNLGLVYRSVAECSKALSFCEKALEIRRKTLPANHRNLATSYNNIGLVYDDMGQYSKALSFQEKALEIRQKTLPANHPDLATSYNNMGTVYKNMACYSKALSFYEKALEIRQKSLSANHPDLATSYNKLGAVHYSMGKYSTAAPFYEKSVEIRQKTLTANHPDLATSYNNLGRVYRSMREYSKALSFYEKALEIRQKTLSSDHPDLATSYNNLGSVYRNMREYSKALSFYEKALEIRQKTLSADHPDLATSYNNLGAVNYSMAEYSKALSFYEKAREIRQKTLSADHPDLATPYNKLGAVYDDMGLYSKALSLHEKALEIR